MFNEGILNLLGDKTRVIVMNSHLDYINKTGIKFLNSLFLKTKKLTKKIEKQHRFKIDKKIENKLGITASPHGYLKCVSNN